MSQPRKLPRNSRQVPGWTPWKNKELKVYVDGPTGQQFISWDDGYGRPSTLWFTYDPTKPKGERYRSFIPLEWRTFMFAALYDYHITGVPYKEIVEAALAHQIRVPGQYPLTRHCLKMWEAVRRRQAAQGKLWPFRNVEEFDKTGLPRVMWEKFLRIDELKGIRPALGFNHGKYWEQNRMKDHTSGPRLYQRDSQLFDPPRQGGTIRQRVWYEVVKAARAFLAARSEGGSDRLLSTRKDVFTGTAVAYATFVDPYSMSDEHRAECIKTVMREALKHAKSE